LRVVTNSFNVTRKVSLVIAWNVLCRVVDHRLDIADREQLVDVRVCHRSLLKHREQRTAPSLPDRADVEPS
jgi:hypothetical protein